MHSHIIDKLLYTSKGHIIISAIFGFTLAILFKPICKKNCVIYVSPELHEIIDKKYNFEGVCYQNKILPSDCKHNLELRH
tara:strand:- start:5673 stop:5912 length:240 start_codon:yes stop_codon:yes gene_type:complete